MKRKNHIKILVAFLALMLMLGSCLKDDRYTDLTKGPPLVELPLAAYQANKVVVTKYTVVSGTQTLSVVVNLASVNPLNTDLNVTLAVDNTGLSSSYQPLPTGTYTVNSLVTTIPAGQRQAIVNFQIDPVAVGKTVKNYALRVVIKDGSGVQISNYNTLVYNIQAQ